MEATPSLPDVAPMTETVILSANTSWYLYNFRASTIRRLRAEGYRVVCLSPPDDYSHRLPELGCEWLPLLMDNQGSNPLKDAALVWRFWRLYHRLRPLAALHFTIKNNVYGTWAARVARVPVLNNVSGLGTAFIRPGLVAAVARVLYRTSMPLASRVFCQNTEDGQLLVDKGLVPPDRLILLPGSGVDLVRFNPSRRQQRAGPFRFLYAGRMLADKGLHELVEAFRMLVDVNGQGARGGDEPASPLPCELWLCGFADVENVSALSGEQLRAWGSLPGVKWLGPTDDMVSVLARVDCVVLASYREGLPRSLLEAGAMGLPAVATDVPGCRQVISDGQNGLLCEARSAISLRNALARMLALTPEERDRMGMNGRRLVEERFGEDVVVDATLEALREILQAR